MPDPRFFPPSGPFKLAHLAEVARAEIPSSGNGDRIFSNVAPLGTAGADDVSFLDNKAYLDAFCRSSAGCCIVEPRYAERAPAGMELLVTEEPYLAYARVATLFHPATEDAYVPTDPAGTVHPTARIGKDSVIGSGVVVGPDAEIGARCTVGPNSYIGAAVRIGDDCRIGPLVSIRYSLIGNGVTLYAGVRIGEAGFGFARSAEGAVTVPQVGRVLIEDGVEVGANSTIDRGAGPDTVVGAGTRIDNLVQIGHNVRIGRGCIIVSQVGIAGSVVMGDGVMVGGQAGIAGHLTIGDGAQIAACAGLMRDVAPGMTVSGTPAVPIKEHFRQVAALSRLAARKER